MNKSYQNFKKRVGSAAIALALVGTVAGGVVVSTSNTYTAYAASTSAYSGPAISADKYFYLTVGDKFDYNDLLNSKSSKVKYTFKCITSPEGVNPENGVNPNKAGNYQVKITATDSKGNKTSKTVYVVVARNKAPKLSVVENKQMKKSSNSDYDYIFTVVKGSKYSNSLLPITAKDLEDGNLTSKIKFSGIVDTSNTHKGIPYVVKATVKDSKGSKATLRIGVKVVNNTKPIIKAEKNIYVFEDSDFNTSVLKEKANVSGYDKDEFRSNGQKYKDLTSKIKYYYMSKVNTSKPGVYKVGLSLKDANGGSTYQTVNVHVVENKKAVIKCENKTIIEGNKFTYKSLGATAYDRAQYGLKSDGTTNKNDKLCSYRDLTSKIKYSGKVDVNTPGKYKVKLTVYDNNKTTTKYVYVTVKGNREATITSRDSIKISVGEKLTKDRFKKLINLKAFDYEDGDLTHKVEFVGFSEINTDYDGTYTVKLKVKDSKGISVTKKVVVYVVEENPANDSIYK